MYCIPSTYRTLSNTYVQYICYSIQEVYPIAIACSPRGIPKTYDVVQEVYPIAIACSPRGIPKTYIWRCPRGIHKTYEHCYPRGIPKRYTLHSKTYGTYLLHCVIIPLGSHMHTSWISYSYLLGCTVHPKRYVNRVIQEVCVLPKRYTYTSWVTLCIPLGCIFIPLGYSAIPLG